MQMNEKISPFQPWNVERETFISQIISSPHWVKNPVDLADYCIHLKYRLNQRRSVEELIFKFLKEKISKKDYEELCCSIDIEVSKYDEYYNDFRGYDLNKQKE